MATPLLDLNADPFVVRVAREAAVIRVSLLGELDVSGAERLGRAMDDLLTDPLRPAVVHIDLRGLLFMDVIGARALARACDRIAVLGATVEVSGLGRSLVRVLDVTEIHLPGVDGDQAEHLLADPLPAEPRAAEPVPADPLPAPIEQAE